MIATLSGGCGLVWGVVRALNMLASGRNCLRLRLSVGLFTVLDCCGFVACVWFLGGVIVGVDLLFADWFSVCLWLGMLVYVDWLYYWFVYCVLYWFFGLYCLVVFCVVWFCRGLVCMRLV